MVAPTPRRRHRTTVGQLRFVRYSEAGHTYLVLFYPQQVPQALTAVRRYVDDPDLPLSIHGANLMVALVATAAAD